MHRTTTARTLLTGLTLAALPLLLSGCGGGDDDKKASGESPAAASTAAPSAATTTTPPAPSSEAPSSDAAAGERPTREAVAAGVKKGYSSPALQAVLDTDKLATCITDDVYDAVSPQTLQALAAGKPSEIRNAQDAQSVTKAVGTCTPQAKRSGLPSLPSDVPTSLPSLPTDIPGL